MTNERLAELEALEKAATPGPWAYARQGHDRVVEIAHNHSCDDENCAIGEDPACLGGHVVLREDSRPSWANRLYDEGSWKFIAASRTAMPELIAEVRELQGHLAKIWGHCCPDCGPEDYASFAELISEQLKAVPELRARVKALLAAGEKLRSTGEVWLAECTPPDEDVCSDEGCEPCEFRNALTEWSAVKGG